MPDLSTQSLQNFQALLVELNRLGVVALILVDHAQLVKGASYADLSPRSLGLISRLCS